MASNSTAFAAAHNVLWYNQKFLTLSPQCAANADVLIEVWCAAQQSVCCGVCNLTNVSGLLQPLWQAASTLSLVLSICMKPQEAWGVLFLAIALLTSQYGSVWYVMAHGERSMAKWVAYFQFVMCMGCVPVQVALLLSPVWSQNGRSSEKMWYLKARADAHQFTYGPRSSKRVPRMWSSGASVTSSAGSWSHNPVTGQRKSVWDRLNLPTSERRSPGQLLAQHAQRPLSIRLWSWGIGTLWLADMAGMLWFYWTQIWSGSYEFASDECDALTSDSEQAIKVASIVMMASCLLLAIWQSVGSIYQQWSASEILAGFWERSWRRKVAHSRTGEADWRLDHPWKTQAVATGLSFCAWLGLTLYFFFDALAPEGFLLAGDDPYSQSQLAKAMAILPFILSAVKSYRSLLVDRRKQKRLANNHSKEFLRMVEMFRARDAAPVRIVYEEMGKDIRGRWSEGLREKRSEHESTLRAEERVRRSASSGRGQSLTRGYLRGIA